MKNLSKLLVAVVMLVVLSVNVFVLTNSSESASKEYCYAEQRCESGISIHCTGNARCIAIDDYVMCYDTNGVKRSSCCMGGGITPEE